MVNAAETFVIKIRERLKELGTNPFAVETEAHLPADAIRNAVRASEGGSAQGPRLKRVQEICDALGLELYIGEPRDLADSGALAHSGDLDKKAFALIDMHDAQAAAGNGHVNEDHGAVTRLAFSRPWLKRMGIPASDASLVHVEGDSMAPTLSDGAVVLINHARREPRGQRIYVFRDGSELLIKRLELLGQGQLLVRSDNPEFPTRLLDATHDIEVIGEVVWTGHRV